MIPRIDPSVRYVGSTWLRGLNVEAMRELEGAVVVQDGDSQPLIVVLPFAVYQKVQEELVMLPLYAKHGYDPDPTITELPLQGIRSSVNGDMAVPMGVVDNRPKNAHCKHCGSRFAGARFATICPECKSSGHTNQPAECPRCTEASAI